jgi:hypothetical protein
VGFGLEVESEEKGKGEEIGGFVVGMKGEG